MTASRANLTAMVQVLDPHPPPLPPGEHELPSDDGEPMETAKHRNQMNLLISSLHVARAQRRDYFAGGNMFVYFSTEQVKKNDFRGPDVFVVLDTTDRQRKCWVVWAEGGKLPNVVIELTSRTTAHVDRVEKLKLYERVWRTGEYYVFDPETGELEGWVLDAATGRYLELQPDARGDLPCSQLGLRLGVRDGTYERVEDFWLRWIDRDGRPVPTPEEVANVERRRAEALAFRADEDQRRADGEQRRADAQQRRADDEQRRADAAEAHVRELEAKLRNT